MDDLDVEKLRDEITERYTADPDGVNVDSLEGEAKAAYHQGRIDEYVAQNAIDERELVLLERDIIDA